MVNIEDLKGKFKNGMIPDENDYSELIDYATPTEASIQNPPNFMEINESRDIDFYLKLSEGLFGSFPYRAQSYGDYFIKGRQSNIYSVDNAFVTTHSYHDIGTITKGQMYEASFVYNNQYTLEVGTTIEVQENMLSMYGNFYKNSNGGIWKVYVDGEWERDISTNSGASSERRELIVEGRDPSVPTKVELVFAGQDPNFPTPAPRGWIVSTTTADVNNSFEVSRVGDGIVLKKEFPLTNDTSNKEFALSISDGSGNASWLPEHNSVPTTIQGESGFIKIVLDGVEYNPEKTSGRVFFNKAQLIQKVEFKLPEDTEVRAIVTFISSLTDGENKNSLRIDWKKDSVVHSGYIFMTPIHSPDFADNMLTSEFEFVETQPEATTQTSTEIVKYEALTQYFTSNRAGMENILFTTSIHKQSEDIKRAFFQHRSGQLEKYYPMQYNQTPKNNGETDYFEGSYKIEIVPNANLIYKLN